MNPDHPLVRHTLEQHPKELCVLPYGMKVLRSFQRALSRQVAEACAIVAGAGGADYILNSKN